MLWRCDERPLTKLVELPGMVAHRPYDRAGTSSGMSFDIRLKRALDRIAAEVKPIAPELHEARESIWTPEQEQPAETPKLWTPGSKETAS